MSNDSTNATRNYPRWVTALLTLLGVLLIVVGVIYLTKGAGGLPSFFPGHQVGSTHRHTKHGIAAIIVALVAFAGAWMSSGSKRNHGRS